MDHWQRNAFAGLRRKLELSGNVRDSRQRLIGHFDGRLRSRMKQVQIPEYGTTVKLAFDNL
jgi:hypothetical protein